MSADLTTLCCVPQPSVADDSEPVVCRLASHHSGPHDWADLAPSPAGIEPKSMRDVFEMLELVYGDEGSALALAYGTVPGGKYPGLSAIEACCTAEGRFELWAATKAMADG